MYAKLLTGGSAVVTYQAIRDIARLITSSSPSTSLLGGFSQASSVIIDSTPAGWTYVGSSHASDQPSIAAVSNTTYPANGIRAIMACSAPCLEGSALKYVCLTMGRQGSGTLLGGINITAAQSVTSVGVATNEGPCYYNLNTTNANLYPYTISTAANTTIHLIANQRHVTLIQEGAGIHAVWEMSMSDPNRFYGRAPVAQYLHATSSNFTVPENMSGPIDFAASTKTGSAICALNAITDVNTATFYGNYEPTILGTRNFPNFFQKGSDYRNNSVTSTGALAYNVQPLFMSAGALGYPAQAISGVVPVYITKPGIGTSGDTIYVNGEAYTWFNAGGGFGLALKTS